MVHTNIYKPCLYAYVDNRFMTGSDLLTSRKGWGQLFVETAAGVESDREDPTARAFEADTDDARVELAKDAASFGYYTAGVEVWDKDYDTAIEKATYVAGLINSTGWGGACDGWGCPHHQQPLDMRNETAACWIYKAVKTNYRYSYSGISDIDKSN